MDEQLLIKYLDFLCKEVEKYQADKSLSGNHIDSLNIELFRFKDKVVESDLPEQWQKKVVEFQIPESAVTKKGILFSVLFIIFGGIGGFASYRKQQEEMRQNLGKFKVDLQNLKMRIQSSFFEEAEIK